ncbi:MAG: formylglycine-generating enzyme family protein [Labilithrix sp.]|nr:formylglycine-generating enzyme family protein [Labilithrix sp.]
MTRSIRETVYNNRWMRRRSRGSGWVGPTLLIGAIAAFAPRVARAGDESLDLGGTAIELRRVPKGTYTRGAIAGDALHEKDEEPAHAVTLTKDFWIGKYPVTRAQFQKFVADTRYLTEAEKAQAGAPAPPAGAEGKPPKKEGSWRNPGFLQAEDHPVVMIAYNDAVAFATWASRKTTRRVRLPTEAEWEHAARGGAATPWPGAASEADAAAFGWFKGAGYGTHPVGQKKANPLGIFDLSGHVFEWCRDVYAPYREGAAVDPEVTSGDPEKRVLRGGSWNKEPKRGRVSARHRATPAGRTIEFGFRVVVAIDEGVAPGLATPSTDFAAAGPLGLTPDASAPVSGPLADGEPLQLDGMAPSSEAFSWGLLIGSPIAAAAAAIAWMLLRGKRSARLARRRLARRDAPAPVRPAPRVAPEAPKLTPTPAAAAPSPSPSAIITRPVADGFFLIAPHLPRGTRVRYEQIIDGAPTIRDVVIDAPETFVLTGSPPRSAIKILEVLPADMPRVIVESAPEIELEPIEPPVSQPPPLPTRSKPPPVPRAADSTSPMATLKMLPASAAASSANVPAAPTSSTSPPSSSEPASAKSERSPKPPAPLAVPPAPLSDPVGPPSPFSSPGPLAPSPPSSSKIPPSPPSSSSSSKSVPPMPPSSSKIPPSPPSSKESVASSPPAPVPAPAPSAPIGPPSPFSSPAVAPAPPSSNPIPPPAPSSERVGPPSRPPAEEVKPAPEKPEPEKPATNDEPAKSGSEEKAEETKPEESEAKKDDAPAAATEDVKPEAPDEKDEKKDDEASDEKKDAKADGGSIE